MWVYVHKFDCYKYCITYTCINKTYVYIRYTISLSAISQWNLAKTQTSLIISFEIFIDAKLRVGGVWTYIQL